MSFHKSSLLITYLKPSPEVVPAGRIKITESVLQNPFIKSFASRLVGADVAAFNAILTVIEASFPAEALYSRMASDVRPAFNSEEISGRLKEMADALFADIPASSPIKATLLATLHLIEPFNLHPAATRKIIDEMEKYD